MKRFLGLVLASALIPSLIWGGATFGRVKTWANGETLTADDLNAEFDNIINNLTPGGIDDYSASAAQMQTIVDPYPAQAISQPTSLQGEIERLRYQIFQIKSALQSGTTNLTYWYQDLPAPGNFTIRGSSDANVGIGISTPTAALDVVGTVKTSSGVQVSSGNINVQNGSVNVSSSPGGGVFVGTQPVLTSIAGLNNGLLLGPVTSFNVTGDAVVTRTGNTMNITFNAFASTSSFYRSIVISTAGNNENVVTSTISMLNVMGVLLTDISTMAAASKVGAGGLDQGTEQASTWYGIWIITDSSGTQKGILLSSSTGVQPYALPTGYTKWRRIGWTRNDANSNFLPFITHGNITTYVVPTTLLSTVSPSSTSLSGVDASVALPPTAFFGIFGTYFNGNSTTSRSLLKPAGGVVTGSATDVNEFGFYYSDSSNPNHIQTTHSLFLGKDQQLQYLTSGGTQFNVYALGYEDQF